MVVVLNIISMLVTLMVHLFTPKGSVEVSMYVFYFFTLTLPGLVFFLGISMFVVHWIKSQGLAILLLLMLIAGMVGSTGGLHGLLDPLARTIPAIFSVEVGSANLGLFLLQRLVFLGLGGALLCFSIFYVERFEYPLCRPYSAPNRKLSRIHPGLSFKISDKILLI